MNIDAAKGEEGHKARAKYLAKGEGHEEIRLEGRDGFAGGCIECFGREYGDGPGWCKVGPGEQGRCGIGGDEFSMSPTACGGIRKEADELPIGIVTKEEFETGHGDGRARGEEYTHETRPACAFRIGR